MGNSLSESELHELEQTWSNIKSKQVSCSSPIVDTDRKKFKEVRVFVSSTFKDFFAEREILVKYVFPRLREWCKTRRLALVEVDLRWGVPASSSEYTIINTCLGEIDLCKQENGNPFFLNMLGHRYGWVPQPHQIPDSILQEYDWVHGASITHMEILQAAYNSKNPNALFMIRGERLFETLPREYLDDYREKDWCPRVSLEILKSYIREKFSSSNQVIDYDVAVSGMDTSTVNMPKVVFNGLPIFAENVYNFLYNAIDRQYPAHDDINDTKEDAVDIALHLIDAPQEELRHDKCQYMVGRDGEIGAIMDWCTADTSSLESTIKQTLPIVVLAERGMGKSSVLAKCYNLLCDTLAEEKHQRRIVFQSFQADNSQQLRNENIDETIRSQMLLPLAVKLCMQFGDESITSQIYQLISSHMSSSSLSLLELPSFTVIAIANEMFQHSKFHPRITPSTPALILLDQVDIVHNYSGKNIAFIPVPLPGCVRCVISVNSPQYCRILDTFIVEHNQSNLDVITQIEPVQLQPLSRCEKEKLIFTLFGVHKKVLDSIQMNLLLDNPGSNEIEWIYFACEDVRTYGAFETVTDYIRDLPSTIPELLQQLLRRLDAVALTYEIGNLPDYIRSCLCFLSVCESGLEEEEMKSLIARHVFQNSNLDTLCYADWSMTLFLIKPFVRITKTHPQYNRRIVTRSMEVGNIIQRHYKIIDNCNPLLIELTNYFEICNSNRRMREDFPLYLVKLKDTTRLAQFMKSEYFPFVQFTNRFRVKDTVRCVFRIMLNQQPKPKPLMMCMGCSMKMTFNPRRLNRMSCVFCGDMIFSTFQTIGAKCSVILRNNESEVYMCRQHCPNAYIAINFRQECVGCKMPIMNPDTAFTAVQCFNCKSMTPNTISRCVFKHG